MKREPVATTQTRQVRVVANILTKDDFVPSSFVCVNSRRQENRGFAQSALFNVDNHGVVGGL
jgi:hypothetical protein